jgi:hypothetical protein
MARDKMPRSRAWAAEALNSPHTFAGVIAAPPLVVEYEHATPEMLIARLCSGHMHGPMGGAQCTGSMTLAIAAQAKPLLVAKIDELLKAKTAIVYVREWARKRGIVDVYMSFYNRQRRSMTAAKSAALRRFHTADGVAQQSCF